MHRLIEVYGYNARVARSDVAGRGADTTNCPRPQLAGHEVDSSNYHNNSGAIQTERSGVAAPVSWAKTKVNRTRSKGLYSPTRNIYVGTGGGTHTRSRRPSFDGLVGDRRADASNGTHEDPNCEVGHCAWISCLTALRQLRRGELIFSESLGTFFARFVSNAVDLTTPPTTRPTTRCRRLKLLWRRGL